MIKKLSNIKFLYNIGITNPGNFRYKIFYKNK